MRTLRGCLLLLAGVLVMQPGGGRVHRPPPNVDEHSSEGSDDSTREFSVNEREFSDDSDEANGNSVLIEDFGCPAFYWQIANDPVMGGRSSGTFRIDRDRGVAVFEGTVAIVPYLGVPGFLQARVAPASWYAAPPRFPDVSHCGALQLTLRTNASYPGYRVSFGRAHAPGGKLFAYGYKATLTDVPEAEFGDLTLPFTDFTDFWDDATGDPIRTCQENELYCPDDKTLRNMRTMAVWAEGVEGHVRLELQRIRAVNCSASVAATVPAEEVTAASAATTTRTALLRGWVRQQASAPVAALAWIAEWAFGGALPADP